MIYLCTAEAQNDKKLFFISIVKVVCLAAARYSPVTVVEMHPSAIAAVSLIICPRMNHTGSP